MGDSKQHVSVDTNEELVNSGKPVNGTLKTFVYATHCAAGSRTSPQSVHRASDIAATVKSREPTRTHTYLEHVLS